MNYEQKDAELFWHVQQLKNGNAQSYNSVYELSQKYIYKIINDIVKDHHTTEDLMQETYLQIYNKIGSLQEAKAFYVWAGRIATNLTLRHIQKYRKEVLVTEDEEGGTDFVFDTAAADNECFIPENILMDQEKQRLIGEILDNLSVDQKLSVQYFYYEEMSVRDIAQAMECSEGTVKSRLNYARKAIKDAVLSLEVKQGTRLYSLSAMPLFLILFRQGAEQAAVAAGVGAATTGAAAMGAGQAVGNMVPGGPAQMVGNMVNVGPGQMVGNMVNGTPGQMVGNMVSGTPNQMVGNMVNGTPGQMVGNMVNGNSGQMVGNMTAGPGNVGMPAGGAGNMGAVPNGMPPYGIESMGAVPNGIPPYGAESMGAVPNGMPPYGVENLGVAPGVTSSGAGSAGAAGAGATGAEATGVGVTATGAVGATGASTAATVAGMATWTKVLIGVIAAAVIGGGGYGIYKATQDKNPPTEQASGGMPATPAAGEDLPQAEPVPENPEESAEASCLNVHYGIYYTADGRVFYDQYGDGLPGFAETPDVRTHNSLPGESDAVIEANSSILSEDSMQELISYGLQMKDSEGVQFSYDMELIENTVDEEFIIEYSGKDYRFNIEVVLIHPTHYSQEEMESMHGIASSADRYYITLAGPLAPLDGVDDIWVGVDSDAQDGGDTDLPDYDTEDLGELDPNMAWTHPGAAGIADPDQDANIDFPDINLPVVTPARMMELTQDTLYIDLCLSNMTVEVFYSLMDQVPCKVTLQDGSVYDMTLAEFIFKDWNGYADLAALDYDAEYARELSTGYVTTDSLLP